MMAGQSFINPDGTINKDALAANAPAPLTANAKPVVYFGQVGPEPDGPKGMQDAPVSMDTAKQNYYTWAPGEQRAMASKLYRAGIISDPNDYDAAYAQWASAVEFAAGQYTYGLKKVTPWDILQSRIGLSTKQNSQPVTNTTTSTVNQVLTNGDANVMIQSMFQSQLGRDPTAGELSRYRSMLINKAESNPQVTRTTSTTTGTPTDRHTENSSTSSGGVSQAELGGLAQDKIHADPEYGAYQAATSYMGAIQSLFGGSPDLTGSNG